MTDGELVRDGEDYLLRFERELPHSIERVWQAITEPAHLAAWFPSAVDLELRLGGKIVFTNDPDFDVDPELLATSGEVIELDPQRRLAFLWGNDLLRFELSPSAVGCRLVFTHRLPHRACVNRTASGWTVCLAALTASLDGQERPEVDWRVSYDHYLEVFGDAGDVCEEAGKTVLRFERLMPAAKADVDAAIVARWSAPGDLKWQLIPIGDTTLVLLTIAADGKQSMSGELEEWDINLRGLADALA